MKTRVANKLPGFADPAKSEIPLTFGVYKGIVKKIDTGTRNSRIWVYISAFGNADESSDKSWTPVVYASPFYGETAGQQAYLEGKIPNTLNRFDATKQTYGFFVGPPDIGSIVLCCFADGNRDDGYWFACISPNLSRNMTPALGSLEVSKIDPVSIANTPLQNSITSVDIYGNPNKYPVGEFNEADKNVFRSDWYVKDLRPINPILTQTLLNQGLDADPLRGAITSSMQRDPVGAVFGFSSPGRPLSNDPAADPAIDEKIRTGKYNPADYKVSNRRGGHSFVMDDGDLKNKNNLVRVKTATGHQILMNDSEGFIYISNAAGTAWVELTKNGDVLIYGQRDFAVRTQGNILMHSDKNISFNAKEKFNVYAGKQITFESPIVQTNATKTLSLYGKQVQMKSGSTLSVNSSGAMSIKAGGSISMDGNKISLNGGGASSSGAQPSALPKFTNADAIKQQSRWVVAPGMLPSINYRVPTHEPYIRENIATLAQQEAAAFTGNTNIDGTPISPPTVKAGPNVQQAQAQPLNGQAPPSYFTDQVKATPGTGMGALSDNELTAYMAQVGYSESMGNYTRVNQFGYTGKYQMGSLALQDLGYVKRGTAQTVDAMSNPNNWTGKDGISSQEAFLANPAAQEQAMYNYTAKNYKQLQNNGVITGDSTNQDIAGALMGSHLAGATGFTKWYNGSASATLQDANGTQVGTYYKLGQYSQTQVPTVVAAVKSTP